MLSAGMSEIGGRSQCMGVSLKVELKLCPEYV